MLSRIAASICIIALLAAPALAQPATGPNATGDTSADTVTLGTTLPAVGSTTTFVRKSNLSVKVRVTMEDPATKKDMLLQEITQEVTGEAEAAITVLEHADGKVSKVQVKVVKHKQVSTNNGMAMDGETFGDRAYVATRKGNDVIIIGPDGTTPTGTEHAFVYAFADTMLNGNPWTNALPKRALKVGESFDIPKEAANRQMAEVKIDGLKLKLAGVSTVDGKRQAEFEISAKANVTPQPGMNVGFEIGGKIVVDAASGQALKTSTAGPVTVTGGSDTPNGKMTISGSGKADETSSMVIKKPE
ncbi:MAG: hypothetical protein AB7K09_05375 [Planctomycetota bacterium]